MAENITQNGSSEQLNGAQPAADNKAADSKHPGFDGIWIFVFIDMLIFLMLFATYISERIRLPEIFAESQHLLTPYFGLANTIFLLTSSWAIICAVNAVRQKMAKKAANYLWLCLLFGGLFCISKCAEYYLKINAGITPATNGFFTFFFLITMVHFLHVLIGFIFVAHCAIKLRAEIAHDGYLKKIESAGLFWHFVDAIWLFIFPLLYLVGRQ